MTNLNSKNRDIHIALPLIGLGKPILPSRGAGHPIKTSVVFVIISS
jgi:hypothetical protein